VISGAADTPQPRQSRQEIQAREFECKAKALHFFWAIILTAHSSGTIARLKVRVITAVKHDKLPWLP